MAMEQLKAFLGCTLYLIALINPMSKVFILSCKGYTKVGDHWLLILHTGLLDYSCRETGARIS